MEFDPTVFGLGFHHFVELEYQLFGRTLAPALHIATFVVLALVFWKGNKVRLLFTALFTLNWLFLLGYWGVFAVIYWANIGLPYLLAFIAAPVLLVLIAINWCRELALKRVDLDFKGTAKMRWAVIAVMLWGFWYPTYVYGQGFVLNFGDLLFSCYGLMPCPTTMVVLSLFTLNYPKENQTLFNLMTAYAIFIGTATVITGWMPDIPFILIGLYAFALILASRIRRSRNARQTDAKTNMPGIPR